ncbi:MAG: RNA polymerase sigma factor [Planctomycetaceae bacterium]
MDGDRTLIERVLAGDVEAFRELVERHQRRVFGFVRNLVRHAPDAEDLVQEVFVAVFRKLDSFDAERSQFSTWLLTIARNQCLNHLKRSSLPTSFPSEFDVEARTARPLDAVLSRELHARLDAALDLLPLEQRTAFVLAEIQELPYAEIAIIEEVELGTIKSRVSRAKQRLREVLSDLDPTGCAPTQSASRRGAAQ